MKPNPRPPVARETSRQPLAVGPLAATRPSSEPGPMPVASAISKPTEAAGAEHAHAFGARFVFEVDSSRRFYDDAGEAGKAAWPGSGTRDLVVRFRESHRGVCQLDLDGYCRFPRDWSRRSDTLGNVQPRARCRVAIVAIRFLVRRSRRHAVDAIGRFQTGYVALSFSHDRLATLGARREPTARQKAQEPMRIIVFGAHPDDCELEAGGTAARWAKLGYKVKFVSVTNGDIGHHQMAGAILARRRTDEVKKCAEILGIDTEVLDIHDGELLPTLGKPADHHPQDSRVEG